MKKYFVLAISALALAFSSCDEFVVESPKVTPMMGNWWIYYNEDNSTDIPENPYSGVDFITTYNTAADTETEMFLSIPNSNPVTLRVATDLKSKTFSCDDYTPVVSVSEDKKTTTTSYYKISDGAIIEDEFTSPTGYPVDQISFTLTTYTVVAIEGGATTGSEADAVDIYYIGFRKTGWTDDELSITTPF